MLCWTSGADGTASGVFLLNSNGMDMQLQQTSLTYRCALEPVLLTARNKRDADFIRQTAHCCCRTTGKALRPCSHLPCLDTSVECSQHPLSVLCYAMLCQGPWRRAGLLLLPGPQP